MHYSNGREAKIGDKILVSGYGGPYTGIVVEALAGTNTCNLQVVPLPTINIHHATASECTHLEDVEAALKPAP